MSAFRSNQSATKPVPWLSAGVLVAALFFSIHARIEAEAVRGQAQQALVDAKAYFQDHPYLEPGGILSAYLEPGSVGRARLEYEDRRIRNRWMETPPSVLQHQQAELESRIETALAEVPDLPASGVAVAPSEGFSSGWLLYPLLHVNNWQLIGNGLLLLLLGVYLERSLGRPAFCVLAVVVTLAGAGAWKAMAPGQAEYGLVGSAPLLAGLLGAFAFRFGRQWGEGFYLTAMVPGTLWLVLPPWAALGWSFTEVGLVASGPAPAAGGVYYALLGAALMGALASGAALLLGVDGEIYGDADSDVTRNPQFRRAMRARAAGRPREAMELLSSFLATDPDAYEAALALHEVARQARRAADARAALLRVIRIELDRELAAAAVDHWLELIEDGIPEKADPVLLIHMALLLREEGRREEAVDALRCALERSEDRASHVVAARIARAARGLDPGVVETAAWRALGFIELELEERQALENLIAEALESTRGRSTVAEAPSRERPTATDEFELPTATDTPSLERSTVADPSSREHPAAATDVHALPEAPSSPAASPEFEIGSERSLDVVLAVPLELTDDGIEIQTLQGQKKLVRYERIQAVAVSAVHGLSSKPVLIVDLVLNWTSPANETLRVIRLRSDRFDPRRLCPDDASSVGALRSLVKILIERSDATPLPDREASNGRPFASYDDSETYHREVLLVEGTASSES